MSMSSPVSVDVDEKTVTVPDEDEKTVPDEDEDAVAPADEDAALAWVEKAARKLCDFPVPEPLPWGFVPMPLFTGLFTWNAPDEPLSEDEVDEEDGDHDEDEEKGDKKEEETQRTPAQRAHDLLSSSDDDSSDSDSEFADMEWELDTLMFCAALDQFIFALEGYRVRGILVNKTDRKVYVVQALNGEGVFDPTVPWEVVIVTEDLQDKLAVDGIPREVRILTALLGAPHVAQATGWARLDSRHFAVRMPYYPSVGLERSHTWRQKVGRQLLSALACVHARGIMHRDLALDNMRYDPCTDQLMLIDWDLAAPIHPCVKRRGRSIYNAPEKEETNEYGTPSDIYAAGTLMWCLARDTDDLPEPRELRKLVKKRCRRRKPSAEWALLRAMTQGDALRRPTAQEALEDPWFTESVQQPDPAVMARLHTLRNIKLAVVYSGVPEVVRRHNGPP